MSTTAIERLNAALSGRYRIDREVGEGGMATVYLADDLKHERKVALKVLKPELAAVVGANRFLAEIKTTANLHHPHILPLFDSGEAGGLLFYVMPYVEGESLRQKLDRERQLPVEEALRIASDLADALGYAHEHGVIHRDIKPANVLVHSGRPLIADFGIALAVRAGAGSRLTETGLALGTSYYMSPEQATGDQEPGPASDTYSLACVLHEMLLGEPPYTGSTSHAVLTRILTEEPASLTAQRKTVPSHVDHAVRKALALLPADRFPSMGAFKQALEHPGGPLGSAPTAAGHEVRVWKRLAVAGFATAAVLLLASGWSWMQRADGGAAPVVRSALEPPGGVRVAPLSGFELSPDGSQLAFIAIDSTGSQRIWIQALGALGGRPLAGTDGAVHPFWSSDGQHIGFFTQGSLKRVPVGGGVPVVLAPMSGEQPKGGAWGADGRIVYAPNYRAGLLQVAESGGEPEALTQLDAEDGELSHRWPRFLADGRGLIFLVQTAEYGADDDRSRIEMLDARGERHPILRENSSAAYASPGRLLFWRGGAIHAQDFDPGGGDIEGTPMLVTEGVGFNTSEWATFSISGEGTLAYHVGSEVPWQLEWRDRAGRVLSVQAADADYADMNLSPDGTRVAYVDDISSLWVLDLERGTRTKLTFAETDHYSPAWSPDGEWIAYSAQKTTEAGADVFRRRSSGFGDRELLFEGAPGQLIQAVTWSPDGSWIGFASGGDITLLDVDSRETRPGVSTPGDDSAVRFSPNGRWIAYESDESGAYEVYVASLSGTLGKWPVSSGGGVFPRWSPAGDRLYFLGADNALNTVTVSQADTPEFGPVEALFHLSASVAGQEFDIAPDGRVLLRTSPSAGNSQNFRLIQNWPRLLEARGR